MITILTTTDLKPEIRRIIDSIDRLEELVVVVDELVTIQLQNDLILVEDNQIILPLDWHDTMPPYVFPNCEYSQNNLLALLFLKLKNHQKSFDFVSEESDLYTNLLITTHLQYSYELSDEMLVFAKNTSKHNLAIMYHYGIVKNQLAFEQLKDLYKSAIDAAGNDELRVFSGKHYLNLLLDGGQIEEAKNVLEALKNKAISEEAINAMNVHLASIYTNRLTIPYDGEKLDEILSLQLESIAFYESKHLKVNAGLVLTDAAEIANFKNDFIQSKEMINKAIQYFKQEDIPEFLGEAGLKKAILLYTWSKNGSPQYYKAAINAFQDTLKVFKKDTHPKKFADVHHHLAMIYSEIPVTSEEKPIWTAFSASSFKNALEIYTKEEYPYDYAMASHNYATALMNFPPAKLHSNHDKANDFFEDALKIRTAKNYPTERALTLLNQLELFWLTHNENEKEETKKFNHMIAKANEVK
ncbi:MAG: hypothetical protein ABIO60_05830, partial [Aquaticitalea sp.]